MALQKNTRARCRQLWEGAVRLWNDDTDPERVIAAVSTIMLAGLVVLFTYQMGRDSARWEHHHMHLLDIEEQLILINERLNDISPGVHRTYKLRDGGMMESTPLPLDGCAPDDASDTDVHDTADSCPVETPIPSNDPVERNKPSGTQQLEFDHETTIPAAMQQP